MRFSALFLSLLVLLVSTSAQAWRANTCSYLRWDQLALATDPLSETHVAWCYLLIKQDPAKSLEWYRRAANQGNDEAQSTVAQDYATGFAVNKDLAQAYYWYLITARSSSTSSADFPKSAAAAAKKIGDQLAPAQKAQIEENAQRWKSNKTGDDLQTLTTKADTGDIVAQTKLGFLYESQFLGYRNFDKARELYLKAAGQGSSQAQFNLAILYYRGKGGGRDYTQAANWARKAAEQKFAPAQMLLGGLYEDGKGVPQDWKEAYFWNLLATDPCAYDFEDVIFERGMIWRRFSFGAFEDKDHLTAEEKTLVEKRVKDWKVSHGIPLPTGDCLD